MKQHEGTLNEEPDATFVSCIPVRNKTTMKVNVSIRYSTEHSVKRSDDTERGFCLVRSLEDKCLSSMCQQLKFQVRSMGHRWCNPAQLKIGGGLTSDVNFLKALATSS